MNDPQTLSPTDIRQCFKCTYEGSGPTTLCPKCGKKTFFSSSSIRTRGIVTVLCGLFISALMAVISFFVGTMLLGQMKDPEGSRRILDEQFTLIAIFALFGMLIALGFSFVVMGGWMIAFGKRNKILLWIMLALIFVTIFGASLITTFLP